MTHHSHRQPRDPGGRFAPAAAVAAATGAGKPDGAALVAALAPNGPRGPVGSRGDRPQEPGAALQHDIQRGGAPAWSLFGVRAAPEPLVSELDRRRQELSLDVPDPRGVSPYADAVNRNYQRRNR